MAKQKFNSRNHFAARALADNGWLVFPVRRGAKTPLTAHGFYDATTDPEQIDAWWRTNPNANTAVRTGRLSNLLVLDIDPRNSGDESLAALEAQYGALPRTPTVRTGGGGRHYYFKCPTDGLFPGSILMDGIDIKADGGYVVAPYSIHASGHEYLWLDGLSPSTTPTADCPEWLVALCEERSRPIESVAESESSEDEERIIPEGKRNDTLASLAGSMQRKGYSAAAILAALLAENRARCIPALPESEVEAIVRSITSRYKPDPSDQIGEPRVTSDVLRFAPMTQMLSEDPPAVRWIIQQRFAFGDTALLVGPAGVGKSWLALDIAIAGCQGRPIWGESKPTRPFTTLIVDEENPRDEVHRRLRALTKAWNARAEDIANHVWLAVPCQGFSFRSTKYPPALRLHLQQLKPDLIIFDSTVAISTIRDENDAVSVRQFFHDHLYPLRDICGSAILCLHHTSKSVYSKVAMVEDAGMIRGSGDFPAAVDAAMLVKPLGAGEMILSSTKVRRGRPPAPSIISIVDGETGGARPIVRRDASDDELAEASWGGPTVREVVLRIFADRSIPLTAQQVINLTMLDLPEANDKTIRNQLSMLTSRGILQLHDRLYRLNTSGK